MNKKQLYRNYFKRFVDIIISFSLLLLLSPVFVIVAIFVRMNLGSPIIFVQKRPGLNEKIFSMYKFRTMTNEKDKLGNYLSDERRLTKFGAFLRKSSLDELPELWNILIGDMSFVGPRPLLVKYLSLYSPKQRKRHNVRPGLTGLAQVKGRNAISWQEKFAFDIEYVENISLYKDIQILFQTVKVVLMRTGINSDNHVTIEEFKGEKD